MNGNPTYRLTFGTHKNKTLDEIPPSYRSWLVRDNVYDGKDDLKAALIAGNFLVPPTDPLTPPSTPIPATPSRKRRAPLDDDIGGSPSSRRKLVISERAKRNGTMLNYDGSDYILDFGKHHGEKLCDVPPDYARYLIKAGAHRSRPDLTAALQEQGYHIPDQEPTPSSSQQSVDAVELPVPYGEYRRPWKVPAIHEAGDDARFIDPHTQATRYISDADAHTYFGLEESLLAERGANLITERDIKRNAPYTELITVYRGPKRWLYQVYACAARFDTAPSVHGTADEALRAFLGKNRKREQEIRDELGFGA